MAFFHNTSPNPKSGVKKHLDDITHIKFQRSHRSLGEGQRMAVGEEEAAGLIRISLSQSDDLHHQVNIQGS